MQHDFVAMAREHLAAVGELCDGKAAVACAEEVQGVALGVLGGTREQAGEAFRSDGQRLARGLDDERCALALDNDAAALQHATVLIFEDGHEDLVAQAFLVGVPVDVEEAVVAAVVAVLKHIVPVAVLLTEAHVVGHDVEYLAEADFAEPAAESLMRRAAAEFLVDLAMVDDVVAVHAVGRGLQIRRAVDVADAERAQVVGNCRGIVEREAFVQLQTVSCAGHSLHGCGVSLNETAGLAVSE